MINKKIGVIIPIISAIVILSVILYLSYLSFNQEEYKMPISDSGLCRMADHPSLGSDIDEQIIDCADTYHPPPKRITFLDSLWYDFLNAIGVFEK